jgi:hypothetical protein
VPVASTELTLKVKEDQKLYKFLSWYEEAKSTKTLNEETGKERNRKGNIKKFLLEQLEFLLVNAEASPELVSVVEEFQQSGDFSPELMSAKKNLSDADFKQLQTLLQKAKSK